MPVLDRLKIPGSRSGASQAANSKSRSKFKSPSRLSLRLFKSGTDAEERQGSSSDGSGLAAGAARQASPVPPLQATDNLWARAEEALKCDPVKKKLFEDYLEILGQRLDSKLDPADGHDRHKQLCQLIDVETRELEDKKWKFQVGDYTRGVAELFQRSFKAILSVKDLINTAATSCPPAALACAGATMILTILVAAKDQESAIVEGLHTTSTLICRLPVMEKLYRSNAHLSVLNTQEAVKFQQEFESTLTNLYSQILEFQARAVYHLRRWWIVQTWKGITGQDMWTGLLKDIEGSETQARKFTSDIDSVQMKQWFGKMEEAQDRQRVWQETTDHDKRLREFFRTLYTCPYKDRKDRNREREPGTCEWFTSHERFKTWNENQDLGILWVSADPGAGKSVLSKYLVDQVIPASGTRTTCYFFFKDDFPDQKSSANALCAILRQLFLEKPRLLRDSVLEKSERDGDKFTASFNDLWDMFIEAVADKDAGEIVCVLDALDECQETDRDRLIGALTSMYSNGPKHRNLKFFCTSRPYGSIRYLFRHLERHLPSIHLSGENEDEVKEISKEIDVVIKSRIKDIGVRKDLLSDEVSFLEQRLTANPQRTYLWVHLILDVIRHLGELTKGNIERATRNIPQTVNEAYTKILDKSSDREKAWTLLHAVLAAKEPLSLAEMAVILAIKPEHKTFDDIDKELQPEHRFRDTLRDLCGLFVVVVDSRIYLLHQTAREFLVKKPSSPDRPDGQHDWEESFDPRLSHRILAERTIWYLFSDIQETGGEALMNYSSSYWFIHFREAGISFDDELTASAATLCNPRSPKHEAWIVTDWPDELVKTSVSVDCLTVATALGLDAVVRRLVDLKKMDVNSSNYSRGTPLTIAAAQGHGKIVKFLLDIENIDIEATMAYGNRTPLILAATRGDMEMVRLLLEKGANVEARDSEQATALFAAADKGHVSVVDRLIKAGADVNSADQLGKTPLIRAAWGGRDTVAEILIRAGADVNWAGDLGVTPLLCAAQNGRNTTVKILLQAGAITEARDLENHSTALIWAARGAHKDVVRLLLDAGADREAKDWDGRSALSWAQELGHEEIEKMLLKEDVDLVDEA
ncbi:hypothetical protein PV04_05531 [Phialophora macrospora]|uniref:Uncharacterized protein n=1 Tax=Phialophora macrospora TaxID=1851006 RepID=A0A0D2E5N5_9EURO|nr:hypothetical protein PV04_05531 [Phialophora macrospora]